MKILVFYPMGEGASNITQNDKRRKILGRKTLGERRGDRNLTKLKPLPLRISPNEMVGRKKLIEAC